MSAALEREPHPVDCPVFAAQLVLEVCHRNLRERARAFQKAREAAGAAHDALFQRMDELDDAVALVIAALHDLAKAQES